MEIMTKARAARVLVRGATGFPNRNVLKALLACPEVAPIAACHQPEQLLPQFTSQVRAGDLLEPGYHHQMVEEVDNRFGPFRGAGNELGLVPRLGTHLVPWLGWTEVVGGGGRSRLRPALRPGNVSRGSG